jgi:hypothetical protein
MATKTKQRQYRVTSGDMNATVYAVDAKGAAEVAIREAWALENAPTLGMLTEIQEVAKQAEPHYMSTTAVLEALGIGPQ